MVNAPEPTVRIWSVPIPSHPILPFCPVHKEKKRSFHSNINTLYGYLALAILRLRVRLLVCREHFDPFWDAMASFIGCYEVAQETGLKFLSQNSPIVQLDWPLCGQEWYFTYIYMKSNGNHEKNG